MGRSIVAVVVAWLLWSVLWVGMNALAQNLFPDIIQPGEYLGHAGVLAFFVVWSVVLSLLAGFVCARIKRDQPMGAVWTLALIQLAVGIAIQSSYWSVMPVWYHLAFLALLVPATVMGGRWGHRPG